MTTADAGAALVAFAGVKRRLELRGRPRDIAVYDDFAHHPTAITQTLSGLSADATGRVLAVFEPRSNTMRAGVHAQSLAASFNRADQVFVYTADLNWSASEVLSALGQRLRQADDIDELIAHVSAAAKPGDTVVVMSNGGFGNIHERLLAALAAG